ncbi:polymorphic toxin type 28 domain-containing protein [Thalassococcus lentus]|uniref:Polymorphic toxin type 28 domain-containing protein n=1 Tax=Thalassococcus lentus TaxID=1210524 RepID=A0ABT4XUF2_9RHOB|nr:polymorphic toxin type 28 domain-containing protein [Thalassococcus lentus]MDA7425603.1 polymorphic toxin type 28 domain-containing protein [Thalassococcus lentus]
MLRILQQFILTTFFAVFASQASAMFIQPDWFDPTDPRVGTNRYAYSFNDPINQRDPGGNAVETIWDAFNVALGAVSFAGNVAVGNYWGAALDAAGVVVDGAATATPVVPGGAGAAITIGRIATASNAVRNGAQKFGKVFSRSKISQTTDRIASRVQNNLDHLSTSDLIGAAGDILGSPVTIGNKTYDHLNEVENALSGLKNQAQDLQRILARDDLTEAQRRAAQELLSSTSNHIDRVEKTLDTARDVAEKTKGIIE